MQEQILHKIEAIPGVSSVGMGTGVPMDGSYSRNPVFAQDRTYTEGELPGLRHFRFRVTRLLSHPGHAAETGRDL